MTQFTFVLFESKEKRGVCWCQWVFLTQ